MQDLLFSYLDKKENSTIPPPKNNAGLYAEDGESFTKKPWGNDYSGPKIEPDAAKYCTQFYAKHHIPSTNRPGNNSLNTDMFQFYNKKTYNFQCYNDYM